MQRSSLSSNNTMVSKMWRMVEIRHTSLSGSVGEEIPHPYETRKAHHRVKKKYIYMSKIHISDLKC
jgi:hypothetical protein